MFKLNLLCKKNVNFLIISTKESIDRAPQECLLSFDKAHSLSTS